MAPLMLLKVLIRGMDVIPPGFRPNWVSDEAPELATAAVWLITESIPAGMTSAAILQPLKPELWEAVQSRTELRAMEGTRHVATAKVLTVYRTR